MDSPLDCKSFIAFAAASGFERVHRGWIAIDADWIQKIVSSEIDLADDPQLPSYEGVEARAELTRSRQKLALIACESNIGLQAAFAELDVLASQPQDPDDKENAHEFQRRDELIEQARQTVDPARRTEFASAALLAVWGPYPLLRVVFAIIQSEASSVDRETVLAELEWSKRDAEVVLSNHAVARAEKIPPGLVETLREFNEARRSVLDPNQIGALFLALRHARRTETPLQQSWNSARFGLIKAVDRYDPRRGYRFMSYAQHWILRALEIGAS